MINEQNVEIAENASEYYNQQQFAKKENESDNEFAKRIIKLTWNDSQISKIAQDRQPLTADEKLNKIQNDLGDYYNSNDIDKAISFVEVDGKGRIFVMNDIENYKDIVKSMIKFCDERIKV